MAKTIRVGANGWAEDTVAGGAYVGGRAVGKAMGCYKAIDETTSYVEPGLDGWVEVPTLVACHLERILPESEWNDGWKGYANLSEVRGLESFENSEGETFE